MCTPETRPPESFCKPVTSRLTLWGLEERFHCSVIGTCLNLKELAKFAAKFNIKKDIVSDSFNLHGAFVTISASRSAESRLINKHLNKKYRQAILKFSQASNSEELLQLWNEALAHGEIAGPYWAIVTHPNATSDILYLVLGKVHMLSHLSGEMVRVDMLKLANLQRKLPELELKLKSQEQRSRQTLAKKDNLIQQLSKQVSQKKDLALQLKAANTTLEKLQQQGDINSLRADNEMLVKQLAEAQQRNRVVEAEVNEWKVLSAKHLEEHDQQQERMLQMLTEQKAVEQMMKGFLSPSAGQDNKDLDLCNRCVLFVGGRTRQSAHFRALVEQSNGRFLHHDGGLEESSQRLSSLVSRSDVVLCPLDCVSHDAMNRIKRDCKQQGKPLQFLRQSGLATFSHGLQLAAAEH